MEKINLLKRKIEEIIKGSSVPEDPLHSKNTLEWLLKLYPDADEALKIAALGHDIERAIVERKVRRRNYKDYDAFKAAHALNSANILLEIMQVCGIDKIMIDDVFYLVRYHETGGKSRVNILKNADSISFFDVNLPHYFVRNSLQDTKRRCLWGYKRLTDKGKHIVSDLNYQNKEIETHLSLWILECKQSILM